MKLIGSCPSCSEKVQSGSTQQLDDVKWVFTPRWLISPQASVFKNTCLFGFDLFTSALCEDEASDAWWLLMGTFLLSVEESFYKHHPFEVWGPSTGILLRRDFTSATVGLFGSRCWFTCLSWMAEIKKERFSCWRTGGNLQRFIYVGIQTAHYKVKWLFRRIAEIHFCLSLQP